MTANRIDPGKTPEEPAQNGHGKSEGETAKETSSTSGGLKSWIPLIANIVLMPVLAYGVTTFVLVPKLQGAKVEQGSEAPAKAVNNPSADSHSSSNKAGGKTKISVPLGGKILVNVAGTAGTRYLLANITLVGKRQELKAEVEQNDAELRDAASSILSGKTISDLEKPGMRNVIRAELISAFNEILGKDSITEIFLTEFAIQ